MTTRLRRAKIITAGVAALASLLSAGQAMATARPPATVVAAGGDACQEFMCGTNHSQVLVNEIDSMGHNHSQVLL